MPEIPAVKVSQILPIQKSGSTLWQSKGHTGDLAEERELSLVFMKLLKLQSPAFSICKVHTARKSVISPYSSKDHPRLFYNSIISLTSWLST